MFRNQIWLTGTKVLKTKLFFFKPDIIHYLDKDSRNQNAEPIFDFHRELGGGGSAIREKEEKENGKESDSYGLRGNHWDPKRCPIGQRWEIHRQGQWMNIKKHLKRKGKEEKDRWRNRRGAKQDQNGLWIPIKKEGGSKSTNWARGGSAETKRQKNGVKSRWKWGDVWGNTNTLGHMRFVRVQGMVGSAR